MWKLYKVGHGNDVHKITHEGQFPHKKKLHNYSKSKIHLRNATFAHPPCFCLAFSPTYSSLFLLLFGKWLLLSWVTGHNQAKHISLKARKATLMVKLGLQRQEEPRCPSHFVRVSPSQCHSCPRPLLTPSMSQQLSFCPVTRAPGCFCVIPLSHLL